MRKRKKFHTIIRVCGDRKKSYLEFGWIENPTFRNNIYIKIKSVHKNNNDITTEMRTDEALIYIQGLVMVIRQQMTGVILRAEGDL